MSKTQYNGICPGVSRDCGMGRTVGLSETKYSEICPGIPGLWDGKDSGTE